MIETRNLNITDRDSDLIIQIVTRTQNALAKHKRGLAFPELDIPLRVCHDRVCPLDLQKLLAANEVDLITETLSIIAHLDLNSGTMRNGFRPQFRQSQVMAKVQTNELSGDGLDWYVALAEGKDPVFEPKACGKNAVVVYENGQPLDFSPSTNWAQGGPIIEREGISLRKENEGWYAVTVQGLMAFKSCEGFDAGGDTLLEAGLRCYVTKIFGQEVARLSNRALSESKEGKSP